VSLGTRTPARLWPTKATTSNATWCKNRYHNRLLTFGWMFRIPFYSRFECSLIKINALHLTWKYYFMPCKTKRSLSPENTLVFLMFKIISQLHCSFSNTFFFHSIFTLHGRSININIFLYTNYFS
jgi:hypothetical protein